MSRKNIITLVKILVGVLCVGLITQRLYSSYSPENIGSIKQIFSSNNILILTLTFLLLFLNWGIEVLKWKMITTPIEKISFSKAWQSVWAGVCIGNLTPGRAGEFAGRILFFSPHHRAKIAATHFVCGITQLIITIITGCTGLLIFSGSFNFGFFIVTLIGEIILLIVLFAALFNIDKVISALPRFSFFKKFNFEGLSYKRILLVKLLFLSVVRYAVFSAQFYLLLRACGIQGSFLNIAGSITIMYLLLSTIPMISFIEVGIRAYIAVLLFGSFQINDWQLSAAATLLWFINIAIPSLIGYVFILKNNFSFSREKNVHV